MKPLTNPAYTDNEEAYLAGYLACSRDITDTEATRRDAIEEEALGKGFISGLACGIGFMIVCFVLTYLPALF